MKKRILSILLAALMVIPMLVMPASAEDAEPWYSFEFEETDIRNYVEGQVADLGAIGDIAVAPTLDGKISEGEYSIKTSINRHTNAANAVASLPVWLAIKGDSLYIATEYPNETKRATIQWDLGVMSNHMSYQAYNRINDNQRVDGSLPGDGNTATLMVGSKEAGNAFVNNRAGVYSKEWMLGQAWSNGVYEVELSIAYTYKIFANHMASNDVYDSPTMALFFYYDVDNQNGVGQTQYCFTLPASTKLDCERSVGWVPMTIIIPQSTLASIKERYSGVIGDLGFDARNAVPTQLARLTSSIATAPVADGTVSANEYSTTIVHKTTTNAAYGDITGHYAVKDGLIYAAFQWDETTARNIILQFGLSGASLPTEVNRTGYTIKTDGSFSNQNYLYKDGKVNPNVWAGSTFGGAGTGYGYKALISAKLANTNGVSTVEIVASLPILAASYADAGWNVEEANAVSFMVYPDAKTAHAFSLLGEGTRSATIKAQLMAATGYNYDVSSTDPTVELPKDYINKCYVDDVDDLEFFGQPHFYAAPSAVVVDGKIGAGEYTTSHTYTELRSKDSIVVPDVTENVNGTNYFAYDEEYIYVGASVYEPNYKSNVSAYQFNISVLNKKDGKVDCGDGVTRINMMGKVFSDGTCNTPTYSGVYRSNNWVYKEGTTELNYRVGESEFAADYKAAYGPTFAGSYDADTKTLYYEFAIKIADLKTIFNVDEVESFNFMNYIVYGDSKTVGWTLYKTRNTDLVFDALKALTCTGNGGVLNYSNDHFLNVVHLDNKSQTRQSASVRLAAEKKSSGLRFKSHYTNEYLAYMQAYAAAKGETMEIGTLIAPADYITGEFTHAALGAGNYVEVKASTATPYANANGVTTIAGSLVNIKESNLARDFAGRGFIKIGNEYFYTDNYTVRNVARIATDALADKSATQTDVYKYQLSDGKFSPYAPGQIIILEGLKSN